MSTGQDIGTSTRIVDLDCTGLLCPLPVYKAGLALAKIEPGERLRLVTTDPGALEDVPAMTRQRGDSLISTEEEEGRQVFVIEKGGRSDR